MRIGGIKERWDGKMVYDVPTPDIYKCKKCGKTVVEHLWVGSGWQNHMPSYGGVQNGVSGFKHCSVNDCEINHRNACDGELELVHEGTDSEYGKQQKKEIHEMAQKIVEKMKAELQKIIAKD